MVAASQKELLRQAVAYLNPMAKKMIANAASRGILRRGTWAGCAFNEAGRVMGCSTVTSVSSAARVFGLPPIVIANFIGAWDTLRCTNEQATGLVVEILDSVGVDTPAEPVNASRFTKNAPPIDGDLYRRVVAEATAMIDEIWPEDVTQIRPAMPEPAFVDDIRAAPALAPSEDPDAVMAELLGLLTVDARLEPELIA